MKLPVLPGAGLLVVSLVFATAERLAGQTVTIRLHAHPVTVQTETVRIGDVAEVSAPATRLASQIAGLDLDSVGPDGPELAVSAEQVRWRIRLAGLDPATVILAGPDRVVVRAMDRSATALELGQWMAEELARGLECDPRTLNVIPQMDEHFARLAPVWAAGRDAGWQLRIPASLPEGPFAFGLETTEAGRVCRSAMIIATVSRLELPTAADGSARSGSRAAPFPDELVQPASAQLPERLSDATSRAAPLRSGTGPAVRPAPVVRAGGRVAITFNKGPLSIRIVNARALMAGAPGEIITVENGTTRRQMPARVLDAQTVELVR